MNLRFTEQRTTYADFVGASLPLLCPDTNHPHVQSKNCLLLKVYTRNQPEPVSTKVEMAERLQSMIHPP